MNFIFLSLFIFSLWIAVVLGLTYLSLFIVFGQTTDPDAEKIVTPTPVPTPTPTSPEPNIHYLPQKAYVQSYAPENGIPSNGQPLQVVPQTVPVQSQAVGGFDAGSIVSMIVAAGSGLFAKVGIDRAKNLTKETMSGTLTTKEAVEQLAKFVFSSNPANASARAECERGQTILDINS